MRLEHFLGHPLWIYTMQSINQGGCPPPPARPFLIVSLLCSQSNMYMYRVLVYMYVTSIHVHVHVHVVHTCMLYLQPLVLQLSLIHI